ncbi:hypothetical protein TNCV_4035371 [Trichonephila clavipes]|nr:hypothetical protein TNCV_4035371 [Trichonephila clavipes]
MLSWCGSDDTKHKKDRTWIRGKNTFVILSAANTLGNQLLVYATDGAQLTQASDGGTRGMSGFCVRARYETYFACRQSGSRMERYTNALSWLIYVWHTGSLIAMDEPHIGCTLNVTSGDKTPSHAFFARLY